MGPLSGCWCSTEHHVLHRVPHPGEEEIPFDFLFGMGNISPDKLCPRAVVSRWETGNNLCSQCRVQQTLWRRIDVFMIESIQHPIGRPRRCRFALGGVSRVQMRFQPPDSAKTRDGCIVLQYGVEGRWTHMVVSAVDILLYRRVESVSPLQAFSARWWADWGALLHPR